MKRESYLFKEIVNAHIGDSTYMPPLLDPIRFRCGIIQVLTIVSLGVMSSYCWSEENPERIARACTSIVVTALIVGMSPS